MRKKIRKKRFSFEKKLRTEVKLARRVERYMRVFVDFGAGEKLYYVFRPKYKDKCEHGVFRNLSAVFAHRECKSFRFELADTIEVDVDGEMENISLDEVLQRYLYPPAIIQLLWPRWHRGVDGPPICRTHGWNVGTAMKRCKMGPAVFKDAVAALVEEGLVVAVRNGFLWKPDAAARVLGEDVLTYTPSEIRR